MPDSRPDPDQLLARLKQQEAKAQRGKLKIFIGACAGVGKTYAMLSAARGLQREGVDVVIGVIETHGRVETDALLGNLERVPLKEVRYRDRVLQEFDLDAALARAPQLILVDELAHSNVAGSRHPKRWQDVEELLDAGIDVWSAMNVQHLESLNDIVSGITGVRVWETVPDRVFDHADEVVIVDLPPDELLQRLKEGKIYLPQQAERAVRNFFRKGNLIALRELALRRTADRVDDEMLQYRRNESVTPVWQTRESLLLCVGPDPRSEKLVRSTARMAAQLDVPWHCVYVETPALQRLPDSVRQRVLGVLKIAQDMGAATATLAGSTAAAAIVRYAHEHNLPRVVLGRDVGRRSRPWQTPLSQQVGALGKDLDVIQIALPTDERIAPRLARGAAVRAASEPGADAARKAMPYAWSVAICGLVTLAAAPLHAVLDLANIVMVFLLAVVFVAVRYGRGPAVLAAFVSVASFDLFYVPPRFSLAVSDVQYLLTFAVMLVVALVIGQLTAGLKFQAKVATQREERVGALYAMSRDLSAALMVEEIAEIAARFVLSEFDAPAALLVADSQDQLKRPVSLPVVPAGIDLGVAQWAFDHAEAAGHGTDTLAGSPVLYVPLKAAIRIRGVLAIEPRNPARLTSPEQRRLLQTCASLLAIALERIHYVDVAQSSTVQMESERLRNSILAAISHDLRTPLAAVVGMADSLAMMPPALSGAQAETLTSLRLAVLRMNSQVNNLLDMARLQSGQVQLNLQWQPLEEVVGSALAALQGTLDSRRVRVSLPDDLPLLRFDAVLIERVLCNLLENAAKYTPPASPITLTAVADADRVRVSVDDEGPGLPPGREEAIFAMFERGRKEGATPGVGLGLAICRAIVQAHGGQIHAQTRPQGGASFSFELPRGTPPDLDGMQAQAPAPAAPQN